MADRPYITLLTEYGAQRIAEAALSGVAVGFAEMAVGDGGGKVPVPDASQDRLVNEVYRAPLNRVEIADAGANIIRTEMIMLPQVGGFWLREAALYDDSGRCLAVASLPPSYKPKLGEGSGRLHAVNLWIAVSDTAQVELKADPSVILATAGEVRKATDEAKDYTDEEVSVLSRDLKEVIAEAIKQVRDEASEALSEAIAAAWEDENPVGTIRFFNKNVNPNQRWPQSKWTYTGENRSIRVATANGSNVGGTGGSDTVTIQQANLPNVQIDVSGNTSEKEAVDIKTTRVDDHQHGTFGESAELGNWKYGYYDTSQAYLGAAKSDADNALMNSTPDGAHDHGATVPAHGHTVTGKTAALGQGQAVSVVESHILLMCWARVA